MSARQLYRFTAEAGPWVAGYRRDPAAATIALTPEEAELDLLASTIVPDGTPTGPVVVPGAVAAIRGARDYDFTVADLVEYLAGSDLSEALRSALRDGVAPERDTLAKLSAALDAAVVPLRAAIQTRASERAVSTKAGAGANRDITSLAGLTTPLSLDQGGTGGRLPVRPAPPSVCHSCRATLDSRRSWRRSTRVGSVACPCGRAKG